MEGLKDLRVPPRLHTMMRSAGFVDVEHRMIQMHTCAWSTGMFSFATHTPKTNANPHSKTGCIS
jgi:hypothetical protein